MNWLSLIWVFIGGFVIGLFFVAGLWYTVQRWTDNRYAGSLFLVSFLGRTLVSVGGFYLLIGTQIENALIGLVGFLLARMISVRLLEGTFQSKNTFQPHIGESFRAS